jgi:hypothetical protein
VLVPGVRGVLGGVCGGAAGGERLGDQVLGDLSDALLALEDVAREDLVRQVLGGELMIRFSN